MWLLLLINRYKYQVDQIGMYIMWLLRNGRIYDGQTYCELLEFYRVAVQSCLLIDSKRETKQLN